jgi:hypothetical protein
VDLFFLREDASPYVIELERENEVGFLVELTMLRYILKNEHTNYVTNENSFF